MATIIFAFDAIDQAKAVSTGLGLAMRLIHPSSNMQHLEVLNHHPNLLISFVLVAIDGHKRAVIGQRVKGEFRSQKNQTRGWKKASSVTDVRP